MNPTVSIILATYNRAELLLRAVASVQRQSFRNWELIIEDDGSTDDSLYRLESVVSLDERIRVFHHANIGPAKSRNLGISKAAGSFITFIDSDDEYLPPHLELRVQYMHTHPEIDFINGGVKVIGNHLQHYVPDARNPDRKIHVAQCAIGGTFFGRAKVFRKTGRMRSSYAEDLLFLENVRQSFTVASVSFET